MPILLPALIFLGFFTFLLQGINNNYFLGVDFCVQISQMTSISLNVTRLLVQEVDTLETGKSVMQILTFGCCKSVFSF